MPGRKTQRLSISQGTQRAGGIKTAIETWKNIGY